MEKTRKMSFKSKIPSSESIDLIDSADEVLYSIMRRLFEFSNFLQIVLMPILVKGLVGKRDTIIRCGKRKAVTLCANLCQTVVHKQSPRHILKLVGTLDLPRNIILSMLDDFCRKTLNYEKLTYSYLSLSEKIHSGIFTTQEAFRYSELSKRMSDIEVKTNTGRNRLFNLIREVEDGIDRYTKIRNKVIEGNLGLCYIFAKSLSSSESEFNDNYQDAVLGLNRAFELYDKKKQKPFDKYAISWVNQRIKERFKHTKFVALAEDVEDTKMRDKDFHNADYVLKLVKDLRSSERVVIALNFGMLDLLRKEVDKKSIEKERNRQRKLLKEVANGKRMERHKTKG